MQKGPTWKTIKSNHFKDKPCMTTQRSKHVNSSNYNPNMYNSKEGHYRVCFRCEGRHFPNNCSMKERKCRYCDNLGHVEKTC